MRAHIADGDGRDRLWPKVLAAGDIFAEYERRTDRVIPLVVLEPGSGERLRAT